MFGKVSVTVSKVNKGLYLIQSLGYQAKFQKRNFNGKEELTHLESHLSLDDIDTEKERSSKLLKSV